MPKHHIIHMSSLLYDNKLDVLSALAALRTRFLPTKKRCCGAFSFFNAAADLAYVTSSFVYGQLTNDSLVTLLERLRLGKTEFTTVSDVILKALELHDSYFPQTPITPLEFPAYLLALQLPNYPPEQKRAVMMVEQALNAQLTVNFSALRALQNFIAEHPDDQFSFVNTSISPHVAHVCALLQKAGLNVHPADQDFQENPASLPVYLLHSSCMYGQYPANFIRDKLAITAEREHCYYSHKPKEVCRMKNAGFQVMLIDENLQETDPPVFLSCS
jgi:hypothetical protein